MKMLSASEARRLSDEANRELGPKQKREDLERAKEVLRSLEQEIRKAAARGWTEASTSLGSTLSSPRPVFLLLVKELAKRGFGAYMQQLIVYEIVVFWDELTTLD
jgi:hypothetical protein